MLPYRHFMTIFPFENHKLFAERVKALRAELGRTPFATTAIEKAGGPSTSHQGRIENFADIPITAKIVADYDKAFTELTEARFGEGFFTALAAAYAGAYRAQAITASDQRALMIAAKARKQAPDFILIGSDVIASDLPVFAASIRLHEPTRYVGDTPRRQPGFDLSTETKDPAQFLPDLSQSGRAVFHELAVRLARRHPAITLEDVGEHAMRLRGDQPYDELWATAGGRVHRNAEAAVDPIDGITSTREARARAAVLGASGEDTLWLGWMILFANVLGQRTGVSALAAYIRYRNTDQWKAMLDDLPLAVRGSFPDISHMIGLAYQYLYPWASARTDPQFEMSFTKENEIIFWHPHEQPQPAPIAAEPGELWLYDPGRPHGLPMAEVLQSTGVHSLQLTDNSLAVNNPAPKIEQPHYTWYPSGVSDQFALLYNNTHGWRAVQTY